MERGALAAGPPPPFLPNLFLVALGPVLQPFSKKLQILGSLGWLCGKAVGFRFQTGASLHLGAGLLLCLMFSDFIFDFFFLAINGVSDRLGWCCSGHGDRVPSLFSSLGWKKPLPCRESSTSNTQFLLRNTNKPCWSGF